MKYIIRARCEDGTVYALSLSRNGEFHGWAEDEHLAMRYPTLERAKEILQDSKISKWVFRREILEVEK